MTLRRTGHRRIEAMLIDEFLPRYDVVERHGIRVDAPASRVYEAIWAADLARSLPVRVLLGLRTLPSLLVDRAKARRLADVLQRSTTVTLQTVLSQGFYLLAEEPGREVLLGVVGRFWTPTASLEPTDPERFRSAAAPGRAKGAWNFTVTALGEGSTRLETETRVQCADARTLARFRPYWLVVRPFSGLIRRMMLRTIRAAALRAT